MNVFNKFEVTEPGVLELLPQKWDEPQPLTTKIAPEPYPIDALPIAIKEAVGEVQAFVKAPISLVATSANAALSLAIQQHVNIKRAEKLIGPVSLYTMTIADSGERKTTCDSFFTAATREYEVEQAELAAPKIKDYAAALAAWSAQRDGLLGGIREAGKKGKEAAVLEEKLRDIEHNKPEPPRVPRLILGDETPENLAYTLAKNWPAVGIVSSEAGVVLGGHGMSKDSSMRNLALLNTLWDGGSVSIGRRTSESFTVQGARLTMALQIQEAALRAFFEKSGELARGTGFMARFMVAWPESTQGTRLFTDPPASWPKLAAFNKKITEILNTPAPFDEKGTLAPLTLEFTPTAKEAWIRFHDALEVELQSGGELYDVRDVASKTADNASRLAALFHVFNNGIGGSVDADSFESASRIAAWHLSESRRFFGELALPVELANAARLDTWLIDYARREHTHRMGKSFVMQYGPLRKKSSLDDAINQLDDLDRIQVHREGKKIILKINPALLEGEK